MKQYHDLLHHIRTNGEFQMDRTGVGTYSVFGYQFRHDLNDGFPLVTTKRVYWKGVVHELLWFLKGDTNIKYLQDNNVHIWDEWADENGDLGPVYGAQWRNWRGWNGNTHEGRDQIADVIEEITMNPNSRRLIVSAWNPIDIDHMKLPPCHCLFQFKVMNGKLSCHLYQRSADAFLGVPFNIASYALLTHMIAHVCNLRVGEFIHTFGDLHIYQNHWDQVTEQLSRRAKPLPKLELSASVKDIDSFTFDDIWLSGYTPDPAIAAPVAV